MVAGAAALYVGVYGRLYGYENAVSAFPTAVKQAAVKRQLELCGLDAPSLYRKARRSSVEEET